MATATLDTQQIRDWDTFHTVCQQNFGFPAFYGRNMNTWIDCLTYLDEEDGMSRFKLGPGEKLLLEIPQARPSASVPKRSLKVSLIARPS